MFQGFHHFSLISILIESGSSKVLEGSYRDLFLLFDSVRDSTKVSRDSRGILWDLLEGFLGQIGDKIVALVWEEGTPS